MDSRDRAIFLAYAAFRGVPADQAHKLADGPTASIGGGYPAFLVDAVREFSLKQSRMETWRAEADLAVFSNVGGK